MATFQKTAVVRRQNANGRQQTACWIKAIKDPGI